MADRLSGPRRRRGRGRHRDPGAECLHRRRQRGPRARGRGGRDRPSTPWSTATTAAPPSPRWGRGPPSCWPTSRRRRARRRLALGGTGGSSLAAPRRPRTCRSASPSCIVSTDGLRQRRALRRRQDHADVPASSTSPASTGSRGADPRRTPPARSRAWSGAAAPLRGRQRRSPLVGRIACSASRRRASTRRASSSRSSATRSSCSTPPASGGRALEALGAAAAASPACSTSRRPSSPTTSSAASLGAGPERLTAAGATGMPQVVCLGALDMVNFGPTDTVPASSGPAASTCTTPR